MAVIGLPGSGKTTLLRCLNRLHDRIEGARHSGAILLDGQEIYNPAVHVSDLRRRIALVAQQPNVFPMTVLDNVAYGPRLSGVRSDALVRETCERCLRSVALWDEVKDRLDDSALELSGGQQQRLCLARALSTEPEVLLLDEPTATLDEASAARIEDLIFELKAERTILIATDNLRQAARVSDVTAFFHLGHLVEAGTTDQMFTRPQVKRTEDYITGGLAQ